LPLFPEGEYVFTTAPIDGGMEVCTAELTHDIPCGPVVSARVIGRSKVIISWDPVTQIVDTEATDGTDGTAIVCVDPDEPLVIEGYEVILEGEDTEFNFKLAGDVTELELRQDILEAGIDYKFEVLAIEESGNQSITEAFFKTP
jgi:hypothetical protein